MKNILVAFDFSKNSMHALEYAVYFANILETGISLVWIDDSVSEESIYLPIDHDIRIEMKSNIKEIEDEFNSNLKFGKIKLILGKGKVYQEIHNIARKQNSDFVFAGTHGVSGYEQYWIGSNANRIVRSSPCPVVTIRSDYDFGNGVKNMLIPIDSSMETKQKLHLAVSLANKLGAKIHLLEIYNTPLRVIRKRIDKIADEAKSYIRNNNIHFEFEVVEGSNVVRTLLGYVDKKDIDLICIMTDQGITTANKFLGPYAQQLINNSPVPILSLRAKEY